jgi:hypothetical protein
MPKKEIKTDRELLLLFGLLLLSAATTTTATGAAVAATTPPPLFNSTSTDTTTLLYDNPNYGIQISYPQDWAYIDSGTFIPGEPFAAVIFMPAMDALQFGMMLQQESTASTTEMPPTTVTVVTMQLPFGNMDVRLFVDYLLRSSAPQDREYQLISTNSSAILSGMPAYEVVALSIEPENRTKYLVVMTIQGERAYAVAYANQESTFEQFLPIAQDMISSFTTAQ